MDDKAKESVKGVQLKISDVQVQNKLAFNLIKKDADISLKHAQNAEILARSIPYSLGVADALAVQAAVFHRIGNYYNALHSADEALKLYESLNQEQLRANLLIRTGSIYSDLGDLAQALQTLLQALDFFKKTNDLKGQADLLCRIGIMHSLIGESSLAIDHYKRSIDIHNDLGNIREAARTYNSCCVDYTILQDYDQAKVCGELSVKLFTEANDFFGIGVATSSIGEVSLAKGSYKEAIDYFEEAIVLCQKTKANLASMEVLETKINLARAYHLCDESSIASDHIHSVLIHANNQNLAPTMASCHQLLSEIKENTGESSAALFHLKKYVEIKELISSKTKERELHHLQILHKTKEAQAENESLKMLREKDREHFQRLTQIKDDFLHNATHDIKNPLLIINTSTYLLKAKLSGEDESIYKHLDQINDQSERIRNLVEDILDLAKLESIPVNNIKSINLSEWLSHFEHRFKTLAESKKIRLLIEISSENLVCSINEQRLQQAIDNILSNAFKYTQQGGQVELSANREDSGLLIQIKDNGLGIPQESLPQLFDRFYRANNQSGDSDIEGTGLGLSIAKLSIEQHGGTIHVNSEIDKGTTFSIHLPQ